eukprot:TRINITY_DN21321_c0_g1_i2.p1 TRINITY_DN21321_c0_g1~~TRINITY_DN21321_c0_g1_i2.p1  ORF type:complete len:720 (+),score=103.38 TRINITY_DN21321_c0_g1_i2:35-2161(+)
MFVPRAPVVVLSLFGLAFAAFWAVFFLAAAPTSSRWRCCIPLAYFVPQALTLVDFIKSGRCTGALLTATFGLFVTSFWVHVAIAPSLTASVVICSYLSPLALLLHGDVVFASLAAVATATIHLGLLVSNIWHDWLSNFQVGCEKWPDGVPQTLSAIFSAICMLLLVWGSCSEIHWRAMLHLDLLDWLTELSSKIDNLQLDNIPSFASEVEDDELQTVMFRIVERLKQYKSYLPQHILEEDDEEQSSLVEDQRTRQLSTAQSSSTLLSTVSDRLNNSPSRFTVPVANLAPAWGSSASVLSRAEERRTSTALTTPGTVPTTTEPVPFTIQSSNVHFALPNDIPSTRSRASLTSARRYTRVGSKYSVGSRSKSSAGGSGSGSGNTPRKLWLDDGMVSRNVTIMVVKLTKFRTHAAGQPPEAVRTALSTFLRVVESCVREHKGLLFTTPGGVRLVAVFNATSQQAEHQKHACLCALACIKEVTQSYALGSLSRSRPSAAAAAAAAVTPPSLPIDGLGVRASLSTGEVVIGHVSGSGTKYLQVEGKVLDFSRDLERLGKALELNILVDNTIFQTVEHHFILFGVDFVHLHGDKFRVFELVEERAQLDTSEWMYELQASANAHPQLQLHHTIFQTFIRGDYAAAVRMIEQLEASKVTQALRSILFRAKRQLEQQTRPHGEPEQRFFDDIPVAAYLHLKSSTGWIYEQNPPTQRN